jgi:hypothetical protein
VTCADWIVLAAFWAVAAGTCWYARHQERRLPDWPSPATDQPWHDRVCLDDWEIAAITAISEAESRPSARSLRARGNA